LISCCRKYSIESDALLFPPSALPRDPEALEHGPVRGKIDQRDGQTRGIGRERNPAYLGMDQTWSRRASSFARDRGR
jgi:hypothetical protein